MVQYLSIVIRQCISQDLKFAVSCYPRDTKNFVLDTLSIITSHILFGLGASLSLVNMQGDWLTIHQSEAPRPNDVLIERLYTKKIANIKKMLIKHL